MQSSRPLNIEYPPRLKLAHIPTPLQFLPRASQRWGHGKRIWIKRDDLTGSTLSGNKVRKLEFFAAYAREQGYDTLITCGGVQSNHARATAGVCAQLGLRCELVLRGSSLPDEGNVLLDHLFGATIQLVAAKDYQANLDAILDETANRHASQRHKALVIPTGGSNGLGIWGYIAGAEELLGDVLNAGLGQSVIVCATGSGGTQAGLTLGMALHPKGPPVVGVAVCDDAQWFNQKVEQDIAEARRLWPELPTCHPTPLTLDDYIGAGYGLAGPDVYGLIRDLAALEGIVLDPVYTGKAFHGLVSELALLAGHCSVSDGGNSEIRQMFAHAEDVIFVHTGGIFGVFPHREGLRLALDRL